MTDARLEALARYLADADPAQSHDEFWTGWNAIASGLAQQVWAHDADAELREAFTGLLSAADSAGWDVPAEQMQS